MGKYIHPNCFSKTYMLASVLQCCLSKAPRDAKTSSWAETPSMANPQKDGTCS